MCTNQDRSGAIRWQWLSLKTSEVVVTSKLYGFLVVFDELIVVVCDPGSICGAICILQKLSAFKFINGLSLGPGNADHFVYIQAISKVMRFGTWQVLSSRGA